MSPEQCVKVGFAHGEKELSANRVVQAALHHYPEIVWQEPVQAPQRVSGFQGLWVASSGGEPPTVHEALAEARVFWGQEDGTRGALHVVSAGRECTRWAAFWEDADALGPPVWLTAVSSENVDTTRLVRSTTNIFTLRDWQRDGLDAREGAQLTGQRYSQGLSLVFWDLARSRTPREDQ